MSIGKDPQFGLDNFQKPKMLNENESVAQSFLNLLMLRPGNLPSMPTVGLNIMKYLYTFEDDVTLESFLEEIHDQVAQLIPQIDANNIQIQSIPVNGHSILYIIAPLYGQSTSILAGFQRKNEKILFDYKFDTTLFK
jgi:hypothetical protein